MQTRLEKVIEQVKSSRKGENRAWIFDENGKIKDDVMTCEVLDILEDLKDYEINVADEWIENFRDNEEVKGDNTYNWGANISNDLNIQYLESDGKTIILIMVHLFGDIRGGYSDYFAVELGDIYDLFSMESAYQSKEVNENMSADLNAFTELYSVYDYEKNEDIGEFYCLELSDLLEEIESFKQGEK